MLDDDEFDGKPDKWSWDFMSTDKYIDQLYAGLGAAKKP